MNLKFRVWLEDHFEYFEYFGLNEISKKGPVTIFTGLQDKCGTDIYCGDIIQTMEENYFSSNEQAEILWEVKWFSGTMDINNGEYAGLHTGFAVSPLEDYEYFKKKDVLGIARKYDFQNFGTIGGVCTDECEVVGRIWKSP